MTNTYPVRLFGANAPWFDDVLRDFSEIFPATGRIRSDASWFGVDLIENEKGYEIKANLPGVKKEDVELTLDGKRLTIKASHRECSEEKCEGRVLHRERFFESTVRTIELPTRPSDRVDAELKDGVLTVIVGKDDSNGSKKIALK